jgi:WD40 repeat protein
MHSITRILFILTFIAISFARLDGQRQVMAQQSDTCDLDTRVEIGETAYATDSWSSGLAIYAEPSQRSDQVGSVPDGEIVSILDGPVCTEFTAMWLIDYESIRGWVVELDTSSPSNGVTSYLEAIPPCVTELKVGGLAEWFNVAPWWLYTLPDEAEGDIIAKPDENAPLTVVSEPVCTRYHQTMWIEVEAGGLRGWAKVWSFGPCDYMCGEDLSIFLRAPLDEVDPLSPDEAGARLAALSVTPSVGPHSLMTADYPNLQRIGQIGQGAMIDFALSGPATSEARAQIAVIGTVAVEIYTLDELSSPIHTIDTHIGSPTSAIYSQDGRILITADDRGKVLLWDTQTFQELGTLNVSGGVDALALSDDGLLLGVGTIEAVTVWDLNALDQSTSLASLDHGATDLAFINDSGDSRRLLGFSDQQGSVLTVESGEIVALSGFADYSPTFQIVDWDIFGDTLIAIAASRPDTDGPAPFDYYLTSWDLISGNEAAFYLDLPSMIPADSAGRLRLAQHPTSNEMTLNLRSLQYIIQGERTVEPALGATNAVAYSPDGSMIAFGRDNGALALYTTEAEPETLSVTSSPVQDVRFTADGLHLVARHSDNALYVWDMQTNALIGAVELTQITQPLAISPDGNIVYSDYRLWDVASGDVRETFIEPSDSVSLNEVYFESSSRPVARYHVYGDPGYNEFRDLLSDALVLRYIPLPYTYSSTYVYSHDYTRIADLDDTLDPTAIRLYVRDVASGEDIHDFGRVFTNPRPLAFSEDARLLAVTDSGLLSDPAITTIWEVETGALLFEYSDLYIQGSLEPAPQFSPLNTALAWKNYEDSVTADTFWLHHLDLIAHEIMLIGPHDDRITAFTFHPAGTVIAAGDLSGQLYVWSLDTSAHILKLQAHSDAVDWIAFSEDGSRLYTFGREGVVKVWGLP